MDASDNQITNAGRWLSEKCLTLIIYQVNYDIN